MSKRSVFGSITTLLSVVGCGILLYLDKIGYFDPSGDYDYGINSGNNSSDNDDTLSNGSNK